MAEKEEEAEAEAEAEEARVSSLAQCRVSNK